MYSFLFFLSSSSRTLDGYPAATTTTQVYMYRCCDDPLSPPPPNKPARTLPPRVYSLITYRYYIIIYARTYCYYCIYNRTHIPRGYGVRHCVPLYYRHRIPKAVALYRVCFFLRRYSYYYNIATRWSGDGHCLYCNVYTRNACDETHGFTSGEFESTDYGLNVHTRTDVAHCIIHYIMIPTQYNTTVMACGCNAAARKWRGNEKQW